MGLLRDRSWFRRLGRRWERAFFPGHVLRTEQGGVENNEPAEDEDHDQRDSDDCFVLHATFPREMSANDNARAEYTRES